MLELSVLKFPLSATVRYEDSPSFKLSVVFVSKELDLLVLLNYIVYYILISYIVNRKKYDTILGKFIVLPGSAAAGAFTGYKVAQLLVNMV